MPLAAGFDAARSVGHRSITSNGWERSATDGPAFGPGGREGDAAVGCFGGPTVGCWALGPKASRPRVSGPRQALQAEKLMANGLNSKV